MKAMFFNFRMARLILSVFTKDVQKMIFLNVAGCIIEKLGSHLIICNMQYLLHNCVMCLQ